MKVREVGAVIDEWAPPALAYHWDKSGLATGDPGARVKAVVTVLSVTRGAYAAAKRTGANMIVSHHPLIWDPLVTLRNDNPHARLCLDLAGDEIACYSAHTNLDVAKGGVNHVLAERLELIDLAPLFPLQHAQYCKLVTFVPEKFLAAVRTAVSDAGAGVIGAYTHCSFSSEGIGTFRPGAGSEPFSGSKGTLNEEHERRFETLVPEWRVDAVLNALRKAHPYEEAAYDLVRLANPANEVSLGLRGVLPAPVSLQTFARRVCEQLKIRHVRTVAGKNKRVQKVAVLGGAGGSHIDQIPDDIDVFVCGDVKYHDALAALDRGLSVIDAGHHGTEKWIAVALKNRLRKAFPKLPVKAWQEPDPFVAITV